LEVNPRLQVEHTITESIFGLDLVRSQILITQGQDLRGAELGDIDRDPLQPVNGHSVQLRITAESVENDWSLSTGKITTLNLPTGNGVRVDAALPVGHTVTPSFDSLLAKLIITGPSWSIVSQKAQRALSDTRIEGVKTNLGILRGIVAHPDFVEGGTLLDTRWLESKQEELLRQGIEISKALSFPAVADDSAVALGGLAAPLFRKGDAWTIDLKPVKGNSGPQTSHLLITRVLRNDFPASISADVQLTGPSGEMQIVNLSVSSTTASGSAATSHHRKGNASDPRHVIVPFPGKLIEVLVDDGDVVKPGDVICVVQQMKMEIEIRSRQSGRVVWVMEAEDGEDINEGILAAELDLIEEREQAKL
jgi:pyruvate carboxylase